MVKSARRFVLALLVAFCFGAAAFASEPITVATRIVVDALPQGELTLVELSPEEGAAATVLRVTWGPGASAWFPVWQIVTVSEAGLFGANGTQQLAQVTPNPGHAYRFLVSYDPAAGRLALRLTDETTGEVLVRRALLVDTFAGQLAVATSADAVVERVSRAYEPADLRWDLGTLEHGGFVALQSVDPLAPTVVRVQAQGPLPGTFRLVLGDGGHSVASGRWAGETTYLTVPPGSLPMGLTPLTLEYVEDDGTIVYSETRTVQAGRVSGAVRVRYDRAAGVFRTYLDLAGGPLDDLTLRIKATVSKMNWDDTARRYRYVPVGEHEIDRRSVTVGPEGTRLSFDLPAPAEAGAWRIDVSVEAEPRVAVHLLPETAYAATYEPHRPAAGDELTIAVLPDTQVYAKAYPEIYMRMTEWLAQAAADEGIAFVLHVGDITDDNTRDQWQAARDAHSLLDGVLPYVLAVGNHDYAAAGRVADRRTTLVNEYWSVDDFPHLAATMQEGRLENAYYELAVGDERYLVISLEFAPSDEALDWANGMVAAHPDHKVLVVTHTYLHPSTQLMASGRSASEFPLGSNPNTTMNDGADVWEKFIRRHGNIFFVVNGHIHSDAIPYRVARGDYGNRVLQMLADFQAGPQGGEGYVVLVTFHRDGWVTARAYSPYLDAEKRGFDAYGNVVPVRVFMGKW